MTLFRYSLLHPSYHSGFLKFRCTCNHFWKYLYLDLRPLKYSSLIYLYKRQYFIILTHVRLLCLVIYYYLFKRQNNRDRETDSLSLSICWFFLKMAHRSGLGRPKPWIQDSIEVSQVGVGDQLLHLLLIFPSHHPVTGLEEG